MAVLIKDLSKIYFIINNDIPYVLIYFEEMALLIN